MPAPKTKFLTNDPLTRKRWAKSLHPVVVAANEYDYLVGSGEEACVQIDTNLGKGDGDAMTFGIAKDLIGEGVVGDESIEGKEEKLRFADFKVTLEELNHAVDTGGKMEEQRVPYDLATIGKNGLTRWWGDKLSHLMINTLVGNTNYKIKGAFFANDIVAPDTKHTMLMNDVAEASMTADDVLDLSFLDGMKQRAEVMNLEGADHYKVRKLNINGKMYYRVILHNYVFDVLRQNTNAAQWGDLRRAAGLLAMPEVEIEYNGLLVTKSERCPNVVPDSTDPRAGVYRGVLLGAQSGCFAWGGAGESKGTVMAFHPYTRDADRFLMIRGGGIFGVKKTRFDSIDYGAIVMSSWGAPIV